MLDAEPRGGVGWAVGGKTQFAKENAMTITLDLQPEIEKGLLAQAAARGVSLSDYVKRSSFAKRRFPPNWSGIDRCMRQGAGPAHG